MQQPSDEIKSKLDIVEVIRDYIQLKPAGINFRATCPFHREKTPSFVVSPEKQIWHCFGCSRGGDLFSFVMEMEGLNFIEALRLLAPKAGVQLKKQDPKLISKRNRLLDIVELSSKYYHKILLDSGQAKQAREYLAERGLKSETIDEWEIGYSPDSWDDLIIFLKSKGYSDDEIFLSGMSVKKEGMGRFYNRFRGRIMFPIKDVNGNTVAFSARVSPEKEQEEKLGKYINSPQTMIYDKSKILFALDKARQSIKKEELSIVAEGQMDAITAHQYGFTNVVASSGTALTADQISLLKRYSLNLALAFDMDTAGELAAERGIAQAMQAGMNIKIIELPAGKDPDECIKKDPEEWRQAVASAKPVMQYYFDKTLIGLDLDKVDNRRQAAKVLLPIIVKLGDKIEQDFWLKKLSQTIDVAESFLYEALRAKVNQSSPRRQDAPKMAEENLAKLSREEMLSELFLALILKFPSYLEYAMGQISPDQVVGIDSQSIYRDLMLFYNKIIDQRFPEQVQLQEANYSNFKNWLEDNMETSEFKEKEVNNFDKNKTDQLQFLDRLALLADKDFYNYDQQQAKSEIIKIIFILKKNYLNNRLKEISKLIAQIEREASLNQDKDNKIKDLMEEFRTLSEEMGELEN